MLMRLVGIRFGSMFSSMFKRSSKGQNTGAKKSTGIIVLSVFLGIYVILVFGGLFLSLFSQLAEAFIPDRTWIYFTYFGFALVAIGFISGVFMAQSQLFDAKDNDLLFSMPLTPGMILGSRMIFLLLYDYIISLIVIVPAAIAYGAAAGYTLRTFVMSVLGFLLLPLFSETLSCLVGWLFALLTSRVRHKQIITVVLSISFFFVYFALCFNLYNYIDYLIANAETIVGKVTGLLYPFERFGHAIAGTGALSGWADFGIFAGIMLAPFALLCLVLSKFSLRLVTEKAGTARSRAKPRSGPQTKVSVTARRNTSGRSLTSTLINKELRRLFGSAVYLVNAGLGFVFLVVLTVMAVVRKDMLTAIMSEIPYAASLIFPVFAAVECFMLSMSSVSACSVSLEGNTLWLLQSLPLDGGKVLAAKGYMQVAVSMPFIVLSGCVLNFFFDGSILGRIVLFLLPAAFSLMYSFLGVFVNLRMPKLDWQDEAVAVKQSLSVVVVMLIGMGALLVPAVGCVVLVSALPWIDASVWLLITAAVYLILAGTLRRSLLRSGERFAQLGTA